MKADSQGIGKKGHPCAHPRNFKRRWLVTMASSRTHTLTAAAIYSDSSKSRFHYFLNGNSEVAVYAPSELSKKQARQFSKINKGLSTGKLPWNIAVSIDATIQNRSSLHTENSKGNSRQKMEFHHSVKINKKCKNLKKHIIRQKKQKTGNQ